METLVYTWQNDIDRSCNVQELVNCATKCTSNNISIVLFQSNQYMNKCILWVNCFHLNLTENESINQLLLTCFSSIELFMHNEELIAKKGYKKLLLPLVNTLFGFQKIVFKWILTSFQSNTLPICGYWNLPLVQSKKYSLVGFRQLLERQNLSDT